jgi:hypothetical protein
MAGRAKENLPRGSLKYLFVYLKARIFKCSYRTKIGLILNVFLGYLHDLGNLRDLFAVIITTEEGTHVACSRCDG